MSGVGTESTPERRDTPRLRRRADQVLWTATRALPTVALCWAFVGRAAASQTVGRVACRLGVGDVFVLALAALAAFHVVKGAVTATLAVNKLGSSCSQSQYEGKQAMTGAAISTAGAVFPVLAGAVLTEVVGVSLWACLRFV